MGYFGKAIALLFYTEILNQNTAFLVHKNTSNRVKSWLKRIYALFGVVWVKFWMKKFMINNGVFWEGYSLAFLHGNP